MIIFWKQISSNPKLQFKEEQSESLCSLIPLIKMHIPFPSFKSLRSRIQNHPQMVQLTRSSKEWQPPKRVQSKANGKGTRMKRENRTSMKTEGRACVILMMPRLKGISRGKRGSLCSPTEYWLGKGSPKMLWWTIRWKIIHTSWSIITTNAYWIQRGNVKLSIYHKAIWLRSPLLI